MSTQPKALRLADELDHGVGTIDRVRHEAAAELRRLHAQRDKLLEALEVVLNDLMYRDHAEVINFARAAIKSVNAEPVQEPDWEVRADGKRVRTDRWQIGIRRIVALLWGNQREFEIDEVVKAVHRLHAQRDALLEALKSTGLFLHHCWCDVQMNDYSFEKLNQQMAVVDAAIKAVEEGK